MSRRRSQPTEPTEPATLPAPAADPAPEAEPEPALAPEAEPATELADEVPVADTGEPEPEPEPEPEATEPTEPTALETAATVDPDESIEVEIGSLGGEERRWLRSLLEHGDHDIATMHPSDADAAMRGLTEGEAHYRGRGLRKVADVLLGYVAKVRARRAELALTPRAVPGPPCFRVVKAARYATGGTLHTLAEGSIVSESTHPLAEIRAQGVELEPTDPPKATPFDPVFEQRRGVIVATRFDLALEEPKS